MIFATGSNMDCSKRKQLTKVLESSFQTGTAKSGMKADGRDSRFALRIEHRQLPKHGRFTSTYSFTDGQTPSQSTNLRKQDQLVPNLPTSKLWETSYRH